MESFPLSELCDKYVEHFHRRTGDIRLVGIEKEIPVTKSDGTIAHIPKQIWPHIQKLEVEAEYDNYYKDELVGFKFQNDDIIMTDAGYGTFEIVLKPRKTIINAEKGIQEILNVIKNATDKENLRILGVGVHPIAHPKLSYWMKKQRYGVMTDYFGEPVNGATIIASDQVHIDISEREIVPAINTMCGISGFLIAIFGNSPVWDSKIGNKKAFREIFWDKLAPERSGLPFSPFSSLEDYINRMTEVKCIMAKDKDGNFFSPNVPFKEFVQDMQLEEIYQNFLIHEGTIWLSARPRIFGTIEVRPCCLQPWNDMMSSYAFLLGVMQNLHDAEAFLRQFEWKDLIQLRLDAVDQGFEAKINGQPVSQFCEQLYEISLQGLYKRNFDEETYILPLKERIDNQTSPADIGIKIFDKHGMQSYIEHYTYK